MVVYFVEIERGEVQSSMEQVSFQMILPQKLQQIEEKKNKKMRVEGKSRTRVLRYDGPPR